MSKMPPRLNSNTMDIGMVKQLAFLSFAILLTACSVFSQHANQTTLNIRWQDPQKFYFSGKGAGAGMALMSTMGPMGMAIGVAIDEGISKDIAKAQVSTGLNVQQLFQNEFKSLNIHWLEQNDTISADIIVERIEFKLVRGGENDVTEVHIRLTDKRTEKHKTINFPQDFPNHQASHFPLADLKIDGNKTNALLTEAFRSISNSLE